MSTEDLQSISGIGEKMAETLMSSGIVNVESLASCTTAKLIAIGISKSTAMKILAEARERCEAIFGFVGGDELIKQFQARQFLTTGTNGLDDLLGGNGFETNKVYEIYGPEGTGKSNLLHQLVCTAFMPEDEGGLGAGTIYIDTEGTFSIKRIHQIAPRFGIDPNEITRNVLRAAPPTSDVLLYLCENQLEKKAQDMGARFFCLDSIATHFRSEYGSERQQLPERQQKANKIIHALKRVVTQTNGVAIMTNQATADVTGQGRGWNHAMGLVVGHESQVRLRIQVKSTAEALRKIVVEKALDLPPGECILKITDDGFVDPDGSTKKISKKTKKGSKSETEEEGSTGENPQKENTNPKGKIKAKSSA